MSAERETAARLVEAIEAVDTDPGTFGASLALVEAGTILGEIGNALTDGADELAELQISRLLRRDRTNELPAIARDLEELREAPWPQIRKALLELLAVRRGEEASGR